MRRRDGWTTCSSSYARTDHAIAVVAAAEARDWAENLPRGQHVAAVRAAMNATPALNDEQVRPHDVDRRTWVLLGGRGTGKTFAGLSELARRDNLKLALIGPALHDVGEVMVDDERGLRVRGASNTGRPRR